MPDFKKYYTINAEPALIYLALTTEITIELWTGAAASMQAIEGTEFTMFGENICGKIIELQKDKKIVQQWYFDGEAHESIVTIKLHSIKSDKTSVELIHTNIPQEVFEEMKQGWDDMYFGALTDFFSEG